MAKWSARNLEAVLPRHCMSSLSLSALSHARCLFRDPRPRHNLHLSLAHDKQAIAHASYQPTCHVHGGAEDAVRVAVDVYELRIREQVQEEANLSQTTTKRHM